MNAVSPPPPPLVCTYKSPLEASFDCPPCDLYYDLDLSPYSFVTFTVTSPITTNIVLKIVPHPIVVYMDKICSLLLVDHK